VPAGAIPASPADVMSAVGKFDNPGVSPFNSTPMDFGLQAVLTPAFAYFATDAASIQNNLRWMLLLSDGKWNEGEDPTTRIPKLASLKIKVFAVGFGTSGQVDYGTLMAISAATPGGMAQQVTANPAYDYNQLAHTFKQT